MIGFRQVAAAAALAGLLAGCASINNDPINRAMNGVYPENIELGGDPTARADELLVGLTFSGGGTRGAAFSFGVLKEIDRTRVATRQGPGSLLDRVDFVSGVSGGSVLAAYYGLKQRAALADFRERFLLRDAEESLSTDVSPVSIVRALAGGVNDSGQFPRWLDQNLFDGATFGALRANRRPRVWINASDIYNRTIFVFDRVSFTAICSDLDSYPIASAVAASAAVPVLFAPIVVQAFPQECTAKLPDWIAKAQVDPSAPPMLRSYADGIRRYGDGTVRYIKLLDGGLVDNLGLSGFTIARLSAATPYGPLTPHQAVKLRRAMFIAVDAGRGPSGNWTQTIAGPGGTELVMAAADTAIDASVRASFTAFSSTSAAWESSLVRWRCSLSAAQRAQYGAPPGWNCRDLKFFVNRISFDQLGPERAAELDAAPTRFKLPAEQVDMLIAAGGDALRSNMIFRNFIASLGGRAAPGGVPRRPPPRVADAPVEAAAIAAAR